VRSDASLVLSLESGMILDVSERLLALTGYHATSLKGRHHSLLLDPAWARSEEWSTLWTQLRHTLEICVCETRMTRATGEHLWTQWILSPLVEVGMTLQPSQVVVKVLDLTQEKLESVNYEAQIRAINKSQGVVAFALDGTLLDANHIYLDWFGYTLPEVRGKHHSFFVDPILRKSEQYAEFWQKLNRGEFQAAEFKRVGKGGKEVWLQATYTPILDLSGKPWKVVKYATNIGNRASEQAKVMFLSNMSHEIRTPMNGVIGLLQLLKECTVEEPGKSYIATCLQSADSLLTVLNDVLMFSRVEAKEISLEMEPFNLNDVIEDVLEVAAAHRLEEQVVDIACFIKSDVPLQLVGDAARLRQVLLKLLTNAVRFTQFGLIYLDVAIKCLDPFMLHFDVSDTGIGMSEEVVQGLFRPFSQADATLTRRVSGSGLGLAICHCLVRLFEGELSVRSRPGRGTTFSFTASLRPEREQNFARALNVTEYHCRLLEGLRVLVIDDDTTTCMAIEETLRFFKCNCMCARSAREGLEMVRAASVKGALFDVVLLDDRMPGMSSAEVAVAIQARNENGKLIGLISGLQNAFVSDATIAATASKPLRRGDLLRLMCSVVDETFVGESKVADEGDQQGCVLVAEDNETNRLFLTSLLKNHGYHVVEAENGAEAVEKCTDKMDVVLMDVHMPVMDGITAAKLISEKMLGVSVVAVTADATEHTKRKCADAGVTQIMLKPVSVTQVLSTVRAAQRHRKIAVAHSSTSDREVLLDKELLEDLDTDSRQNFVGAWLGEAAESLEKLAREVEGSAWARVAETAHRFAGSSLQIGATKLGLTLQRLESGALAGGASLVRMRAIMKDVHKILQQTRAVLTETFAI
jgi:two-component system sensor histidine kinase/response regulator